MMRVALISDLHGNELALEAALDDIARLGVDEIVCLGDVATLGPRPSAILARLRALGCVCILGNHDEFLFNPELLRKYTEAPIIVEAVDWCRAQLSSDELDFLRSFRAGHEIALDDGASLLLFHGSPKSHMQDLLATTPPDELDRLLDGKRARVMAGGHTHIQMLRQHHGDLLVNPGSVGMPFRDYVAGQEPTLMLHAEYAIVEGAGGHVSVILRRVPLAPSALQASVRGSHNPMAPVLLTRYGG
jgi:putative phosphoesterase